MWFVCFVTLALRLIVWILNLYDLLQKGAYNSANISITHKLALYG